MHVEVGPFTSHFGVPKAMSMHTSSANLPDIMHSIFFIVSWHYILANIIQIYYKYYMYRVHKYCA